MSRLYIDLSARVACPESIEGLGRDDNHIFVVYYVEIIKSPFLSSLTFLVFDEAAFAVQYTARHASAELFDNLRLQTPL